MFEAIVKNLENLNTSTDEKTIVDVEQTLNVKSRNERIRYSRDALNELKDTIPSRTFPKILSSCFINRETGRWDPEKWLRDLNGVSREESSTIKNSSSYGNKRVDNPTDKNGLHKKRTSLDSRDRIFEESQDTISLSPQRRPFNTGFENIGSNRRIGSGRILPHVVRYVEEEPEWFTSGPTSRNETIELKGFDEDISQQLKVNQHNESKVPPVWQNMGTAQETLNRLGQSRPPGLQNGAAETINLMNMLQRSALGSGEIQNVHQLFQRLANSRQRVVYPGSIPK